MRCVPSFSELGSSASATHFENKLTQTLAHSIKTRLYWLEDTDGTNAARRLPAGMINITTSDQLHHHNTWHSGDAPHVCRSQDASQPHSWRV